MKFCEDCGQSGWYHIASWAEGLAEVAFPSISISEKFAKPIDSLMERAFSALGLLRITSNFSRDEIPLRSRLVVEEAEKRGWSVKAFRGPAGFTGHFRMNKGSTWVRFDGLPVAEFSTEGNIGRIDDKQWIKRELSRMGFPVPQGRSFFFWQKKAAIEEGERLGFPLVVKPRSGSVARHVTTAIRNKAELSIAIKKAVIYEPSCIVEKQIEGSVHRATVIYDRNVFVAKQKAAYVTGDGRSSIEQLIEAKNARQNRSSDRRRLYHPLVADAEYLSEAGLSLSSILEKGKSAELQRVPFMRFGGEFLNVSDVVHPDNRKLFIDIAEAFKLKVVGIDFIAPDITVSWKDQICGVLELNAVPSIEIHQCPVEGVGQNVASSIMDMVEKYYD